MGAMAHGHVVVIRANLAIYHLYICILRLSPGKGSYYDFVGLARRRDEATTMAGSADQTRKFYFHVPFEERYLFIKTKFAD